MRVSEKGFTLLEVLVALAVLAVVVTGVLASGVQRLKTQDHLEQKLAAIHLTSNLAAEYRLQGLPKDALLEEGEAEVGGRAFRWRRELVLDEESGLHDVTISAGEDLDFPVYALSWRF